MIMDGNASTRKGLNLFKGFDTPLQIWCSLGSYKALAVFSALASYDTTLLRSFREGQMLP